MDVKAKSFFKPLTLLQFILVNLLFSLIVLAVFFRDAFSSGEAFLISLAWATAICTTQWLGPATIIHILDKKLKWTEKPWLRMVLELFLLVLWSVTAFILVQLTMYWLILDMAPVESWSSIKPIIIITLMISLLISLIFTSVGFFLSWRKSVLNEAQLQSMMVAYKYEALRAQLNPHFLFNSFNVLSDLVYSDQDLAVKFIRQLSDLFHYVLESRDKELVPLSDELRFLDSYNYLLKIRFGEKLKIRIDINGDNRGLVVPMSLQLLVENAVKHNEVSEKYPLEISITNHKDYVEVENARKPKDTGEFSKATGLVNIFQQYALFTDKKVEVDENNEFFRVRIPVIYEFKNERTDH